MAAKKEAKHYGLRLTLPGAPTGPEHPGHHVMGVPGAYWPDRPTPVGGPGEISLDKARELDRGHVDLELVEMTAAEYATRQAECHNNRERNRVNPAALRPVPAGHEKEIAKDQAAGDAEEG